MNNNQRYFLWTMFVIGMIYLIVFFMGNEKLFYNYPLPFLYLGAITLETLLFKEYKKIIIATSLVFLLGAIIWAVCDSASVYNLVCLIAAFSPVSILFRNKNKEKAIAG